MRSLSLGTLALALAVGGAQAATTMNYGYTVSGDPQARPIQAFDDGQRLYVQFRDVTSPPAPIGADGPLAYTIRGPYLVLPILSSVQLRYGPFSAWVRADGMADAPGVASVTRPIEVSPRDLAADGAQPVAVAAPALPRTLPAPPAVSPRETAAGGVSGEIVAVGDAGERSSAGESSADAARPAPVPAAGARTITFAEGRTKASFQDFAGRRVVIRADGTTGGATAALAARSSCEAAHAVACAVEYRGAPGGQLYIAERN